MLDEQIRAVLAEHGRLTTPITGLPDGADLYAAGLSSHACVNVMLALEDTFDVEFPDDLLRRETFASVEALQAALIRIGVAAS